MEILERKLNGRKPNITNGDVERIRREFSEPLYEAGYNFIPLGDNKKPRIKWKQYQTERVPRELYDKWVTEGNLALLTGKPPTDAPGIVVIDADDKAAAAAVANRCPSTPLTQRTRRGLHQVYRMHPDHPVRNRQGVTIDGESYSVDVRGDGGFIVAPGSYIGDGQFYETDGTWTLDKIKECPFYDPTWLPDDRPQTSGMVASSDEDHEDAVDSDALPSVEERRRQATAYLKAVPGTTVGERASNACFRLAIVMVWGFALPAEDAIELMAEWGQRDDQLGSYGECHPWTEQEIAHKVNDAVAASYSGTVGDKLRGDNSDLHALEERLQSSGVVDDDWTVEIVEPEQSRPIDLADLAALEYATEKRTSQVEPAVKLLRWNDVQEIAKTQVNQWVWKNMLDKGTLTLFSGLPFSGKTFVMNLVITHIAGARPFLGMATVRVPILYINADAFREKLIVRNVTSAMSEATQHNEVQRVFFTPPKDNAVELDADYLDRHIDAMRKILANEDTSDISLDRPLVIVDTLRTAVLTGAEMGGENDSATMSNRLRPLRAWCSKAGAAMTLLHHNNKGRDEYAGSAAIAGNTDGLWNMSRQMHSNVSTLSVTTRDDFIAKFQITKTATGITFERLSASTTTGEKATTDEQHLANKLEAGTWYTVDQIVDLTDWGRTKATNVAKEHMTRRNEGGKSNPFEWCLK